MTAITTQTGTGQVRSVPPVIEALSPTEWRVRTTELPEGDGRSVLGVVQLIGDTYEVMQIGAPLTRYYFASLEDAVGYLDGAR
ncbi:hypothetical protein ACX3O0_11285 [Homoserinimonas sp. A447]